MKDKQSRDNPSNYTTQASVFNLLSVEFDQQSENKPADEIPLKTSKIPAMELISLQQDKTLDIFEKCHPQFFPSNSSILVSEAEGEASYLPMNSSPSGLPPLPDAKSKSLERNHSAVNALGRSSLERRQLQMADYSMKGNRSTSLIRQYSAGINQTDNAMMRSASLERNQQFSPNFKTIGNSEKFQNPPPPYSRPMKGGSLERNQAVIMNDLMRKYYDQKALCDAQKPRSGGSLERNVQYQQYLMLQKQQLQQQFQTQQSQSQPEELIEENIYDFGGVTQKSCATIALKKSIERGMLPPNHQAMRSPGYESNLSFSQMSLTNESRPSLQPSIKQPCPGIASRLMIFQGSQTMSTNPQKTFCNSNYFTLPTEAREPQVR